MQADTENKTFYKKWWVWVVVAVVAAGIVVAINFAGGGGGIPALSGDTAAIVNQTKISEAKVTANIESIRANYTSEQEWANALYQSGNTPEKLREMVIEQLIKEELLAQYAKEHKLSVDEKMIDEQLLQAKAAYENGSEWEAYLRANGFDDEAAFREYLYKANLSYLVSESLMGSDKDLGALQDELRAKAAVEIKPMPQGLPYVVAMPEAEKPKETAVAETPAPPEAAEAPEAPAADKPPAESETPETA